MKFEQMEYIVKVANEKSMNKAAEKLHITSSGISQSISQLENELGITIFNRSKKGTVPTEEGKIVIKRASEVLQIISKLNEELFNYKNNKNVHLKVVAAPTFASVLQQALNRIHGEHPNVTIEIEEKAPPLIMETIRHTEYDFCFFPQDLEILESEKNISYDLIRTDRVHVIVGIHSPLFHFSYVTQSDVLNMDTACYSIYSDYYYSKLIKKNKNKIKITTNSINILAEAVKEQNLIVYSHESGAKLHPDILSGMIKSIPYKEIDDYVYKDLWVIYPKNKNLTDISKKFIEIVKELATQ
ncbi:LysR family transcriptional regulator [Bacillus sp. OAE603]|uniref:LysR family transcriptional regulator n=1 Tax=Gottfriedia sp. OAE603 TaxID=2663872 RepID=UPI00178B7388